MKSQYPCVVKNKATGEYLSKGWSWYLSAMWVSELKKAKVYRNSSGAKNAINGVEHFSKKIGTPVEVAEFHTEFWDKEMERRNG